MKRGTKARGTETVATSAAPVAAAWLPDGAGFVSLHADGDLVVRDGVTGATREVLATGETEASCVALLPGGGSAVVAGGKGVTAWDLATGERAGALGTMKSAVTAVVAASVGPVWLQKTPVQRVIAADASGDVALFVVGGTDARRSSRVRREHKGRVAALVALPGGERTLSAGVDGKLRVHDVTEGDLVAQAVDPGEPTALAVFPDGTRAVTATGARVVVWELARFDVPPGTHAVTRLQPVPGTERLLSAHVDGVVRLWDAATGTVVREAKVHAGAIECLEVLAGAEVAVSSADDGSLVAWSIDTGRVVRKTKAEKDYRPEGITPFPQARKVVWRGAGNDTWLHVWDIGTGETVDLARKAQKEGDDRLLTMTGAGVERGERRVVGVDGHDVVVWDLARPTKPTEHALGTYGYAVLAPDARTVLRTPAESGDRGRGILTTWDAMTGKKLRSVRADTGVVGARFLPSGVHLLRSRAREAGKKTEWIQEVWRLDGEAPQLLGVLEGAHPSRVLLEAWSADGALVATASHDANRAKDDRRPVWERTGVVCVWDVATSALVGRWETPAVVRRLAITPAGRVVVGLFDGQVAFFALAPRSGARSSGRRREPLVGLERIGAPPPEAPDPRAVVHEGEGDVTALAVVADGRIAVADRLGGVRLLGARVTILAERNGGPPTTSLAASPDGRRLLACGAGLTLFDVETGAARTL